MYKKKQVHMEKLINCDIIIDIEMIENISGANRYFEVFFSTKDKTKYKIIFNYVWDMRYSIENGYIDRFYNFLIDVEQKSSVVVVENSEYIKYFENQVSHTLPIDELKDYILSDAVDTVLEILTLEEPILVRVD